VLNLDSLVEVLGRNGSANGLGTRQIKSIAVSELTKTFAEALRRRANNEQIRIEPGQ
jgi:hypothetical protein